MIARRHDKLTGVLCAGPSSMSLVSPLSLADYMNANPLRVLEPQRDSQVLDKRVISADQDRLVVKLTLTDTVANWKIVRTVRFLMSGDTPTIDEVSYDDSSTGRLWKTVSRASDFVDVPGGRVARTVRFVRGPYPGEDVYRARIWSSTDLGAAPFTHEDFVVDLPPDVNVSGVLNAPPPGDQRRLDLADYSLNDLYLGLPPVAPFSRPGPAGRSQWSTAVFVLTTVLVLGLGGAAVWHRLRRG